MAVGASIFLTFLFTTFFSEAVDREHVKCNNACDVKFSCSKLQTRADRQACRKDLKSCLSECLSTAKEKKEKQTAKKYCLYTNKMGNHTCFSPSQREQYKLSSKKCQGFYDTKASCIEEMTTL